MLYDQEFVHYVYFVSLLHEMSHSCCEKDGLLSIEVEYLRLTSVYDSLFASVSNTKLNTKYPW